MTLAVPGAIFLLLSVGLVWSVVGLVRGNRGGILVSVPPAPRQEITRPSAAMCWS